MPCERVGHWLQTIDNKGLLRHLRSDALGNRSASTWTARISWERLPPPLSDDKEGRTTTLTLFTSRSYVFLLERRRHRIPQFPSPSWPRLKRKRHNWYWPRNIRDVIWTLFSRGDHWERCVVSILSTKCRQINENYSQQRTFKEPRYLIIKLLFL